MVEENKKIEEKNDPVKSTTADNGAGNKNLDGIRRLEGKELARSRKIVLDFIGEKDEPIDEPIREEKGKPLSENLTKQTNKSFDGVIGPKEKLTKPGQVDNLPVQAGKKIVKDTKKFDKIKEGLDIISEAAKKTALPLKKMSMDGLSSRVSAVKKLTVQDEGLPAKDKATKDLSAMPASTEKTEQARKDDRQAKKEDKKSKQAKGKEIESKQKEKIKKEKSNVKQNMKDKVRADQEKKLKERAIKMKLILKRKKDKKDEYAKKIQRFKNNLIDFYRRIFNISNIKRLLKTIAFSFIFLIVTIILLYSVYALFILKFDYYQNIDSRISKFIPVPVAISKAGFIEYRDYLLILESFSEASTEDLKQEIKARIIEAIALKKLARKFGVEYKVNDQEARQVIARRIMLEGDINLVAYSRISKIFQLISEGEDFDEMGERYGDEFGYINDEKESIKIQENMSNQISEIIISSDGYNIYKKENGKIKYIFIKAINLDEYIDNFVSKTKVWILAR